MSPGKAAAQSGHAFLGAFLQAPTNLQNLYHAEGLGTKVCLTAPNLETLLRAHWEAEQAGLPTSLIIDSGHKYFHEGRPIVTALGVGPALKKEIKRILKFKIYE